MKMKMIHYNLSLTALVALMFSCCAEVDAAMWSASFPNGTTLDACTGDVTFPWEITLGEGETIKSIEWVYHNRTERLIATFTYGNFFSMPAFSQRVQHVPSVGLILTHVTEGDAGRYIVQVLVTEPSGDVSFLRHTALLVITSRTNDATLVVSRTQNAVYDNTTGQFHVQLTCISQGRQPSTVIWTDPSGASHVVSPSSSGEFSLLVPNPVSGGDYTCRLPPDSPTAKCPPLGEATVYVDGVDARLTLLEADNTQQASSVHVLQTVNTQQGASIRDLQAENAQLKSKVDNLITKRVAFFARMYRDSGKLVDSDVLILPRVVYNQGNGYSSTSGIFTAPYSGTYAFLVSTFPSQGSSDDGVFLKLDGSVVNQCDSVVDGDAAPCNAVLHLRAGQRVWLDCWNNGHFRFFGTVFSGFLLHPDP